MNLTPSQKGSFLAGGGLWVLIWASVWKAVRPHPPAIGSKLQVELPTSHNGTSGPK